MHVHGATSAACQPWSEILGEGPTGTGRIVATEAPHCHLEPRRGRTPRKVHGRAVITIVDARTRRSARGTSFPAQQTMGTKDDRVMVKTDQANGQGQERRWGKSGKASIPAASYMPDATSPSSARDPGINSDLLRFGLSTSTMRPPTWVRHRRPPWVPPVESQQAPKGWQSGTSAAAWSSRAAPPSSSSAIRSGVACTGVSDRSTRCLPCAAGSVVASGRRPGRGSPGRGGRRCERDNEQRDGGDRPSERGRWLSRQRGTARPYPRRGRNPSSTGSRAAIMPGSDPQPWPHPHDPSNNPRRTPPTRHARLDGSLRV